MASWIVLDWDNDQFHVLVAQSSRRSVTVTRALTWAHPEPFTPSTAQRVGAALRDFLKSAKIGAAPVILGLGRDRIFLKELRFPVLAAHEEANLVRFQTGKELTESIEQYAVDYVRLNEGSGERQIMTVAARRDVVAMVQTMCQAAGLKLHAITPRVFGVAQALNRAVHPEPSPLGPRQLNVVLTIGQRWAELCFFKGDRLLQAQAVANGPHLVAEVKRNLAVFQAQHAVSVDLSGPECLYVFGEDGAVVEALGAALHLPVKLLNPLGTEPTVASPLPHPAYFAGGVGLAALWARTGEKPINLASPKRASAPVSAGKQRGMLWGAGLAAGILIFVGCLWYTLNMKRNQLKQIIAEKTSLEKQLDDVREERAEAEAYKDWEDSSISWIDELYDLTQRYPYEQGFRVNSLTASTNGTKKGSKDPHVAKITVKGVMPPGRDDYVKQLKQSMVQDTHVKANVDEFAGRDYAMRIEIMKQPAKKYETLLVPPPRVPVVVQQPPATKEVAPAEEKKKEMEPSAEDDDQ